MHMLTLPAAGSGWYFAAGHWLHWFDSVLASSGWYVPGGHDVHCALPASDLYLPVAQATHARVVLPLIPPGSFPVYPALHVHHSAPSPESLW
jgi:hypothetical protein